MERWGAAKDVPKMKLSTASKGELLYCPTPGPARRSQLSLPGRDDLCRDTEGTLAWLQFGRALGKPRPAFLSEKGFTLGPLPLWPSVLESAQAAVRSPDGVTSIEMPAHLHPQPGAGSPLRLLGQ